MLCVLFAMWPRASHSESLGLSCHIAKMKCLLTLSLKFFPRLKPYVWKMSVSSNECPYMLGENMYGLEMGSV